MSIEATTEVAPLMRKEDIRSHADYIQWCKEQFIVWRKEREHQFWLRYQYTPAVPSLQAYHGPELEFNEGDVQKMPAGYRTPLMAFHMSDGQVYLINTSDPRPIAAILVWLKDGQPMIGWSKLNRGRCIPGTSKRKGGDQWSKHIARQQAIENSQPLLDVDGRLQVFELMSSERNPNLVAAVWDTVLNLGLHGKLPGVQKEQLEVAMQLAGLSQERVEEMVNLYQESNASVAT